MYKYFVGIDGGGTKTLVKSEDVDGKLIFLKEYSSTNFQSIGKLEFEKRMNDIFSDLRFAKIKFTETSLCIGAAGVDSKIDGDYLESVILKLGFYGKLQIYNDGVIAMVGGNNSIDGAVFIAGTGSIALGYKNGKEYRVGGWGHLLGDEGSGYKISIEILSEILKSLDGRNNELEDSNNLLNLINLSGSDEVLKYVYDREKDKSHIAKLAKVFLSHYDNSGIIRRVLSNNLEENLIIIETLSNKMQEKYLKLSLCGGLFEKSDLYYELMKGKIKEMSSTIEVHKPKCLPVDGALILSKN